MLAKLGDDDIEVFDLEEAGSEDNVTGLDRIGELAIVNKTVFAKCADKIVRVYYKKL